MAQAQRTEVSNDPDGRLHFTEKDLPTHEKDPAGPSEIEQFARGRGFNYAADTRRAVRGDTQGAETIFLDRARCRWRGGGECRGRSHCSLSPSSVVEKFAKFLVAQPLPFRMMVRNLIVGDGVTAHAIEYLSRHFPQTTRALFQREMIAWFSPNDLYAIRKSSPTSWG